MKIIKTANYIKIAKKEWDPNPWAICKSKIDEDKEPEKIERCILDVKKDQKKAKFEGQVHTPEMEDEYADRREKLYKKRREIGDIPDKSERQRGSRVSPKEVRRGLETTPTEMDDMSWKKFC